MIKVTLKRICHISDIIVHSKEYQPFRKIHDSGQYICFKLYGEDWMKNEEFQRQDEEFSKTYNGSLWDSFAFFTEEQNEELNRLEKLEQIKK